MPTKANQLLEIILSQQSESGPHAGEFGDHRDQSRRHQPSVVTDMVGKPRLYMTLWPCRVLRRRGLAQGAQWRAVRRVKNLLEGGIVLGEEDNAPITPRSRYVSYRHSICAALILLEMDGPNRQTDDVLRKMLGPRSCWRTDNGGWAYGNAQPSDSDLYTSLYAIELLNHVHISSNANTELKEVASNALETSLGYLENAWIANGWSYDKVNSEETLPLVFAQAASILEEHRPELFNEVKCKIRLVRHPVGGLCAEYRERVNATVSDQSCLARLAYAAYLARHPEDLWREFAELALAGDLRGLTSSELAWLLDLELIPKN